MKVPAHLRSGRHDLEKTCIELGCLDGGKPDPFEPRDRGQFADQVRQPLSVSIPAVFAEVHAGEDQFPGAGVHERPGSRSDLASAGQRRKGLRSR